MTGWPWSKRNDDDPDIESAREEMEDFINIVRRNPFEVFNDDDIEDNPAYEEYEDEVEDARFNAYAMMSDDLDEMEAEEDDADEADGGSLWDE
ncbi:MAG: hypothetical protein JNL34_01250 [Anaerolineae bacterium]|nr:hypothetical protein [Anaerolineae bacterium]